MKMRLLAYPLNVVSERGQIFVITKLDEIEELAKEFGYVPQFDPRSPLQYLEDNNGKEVEANGRFES